jgi:hypothetical protein
MAPPAPVAPAAPAAPFPTTAPAAAGPTLTPQEEAEYQQLMATIQANAATASPTDYARFAMLAGRRGS